MESQNCYSTAEMRRTLCTLAPFFDVVRVVDPADTAVLTLEEDGTIRKEPYTCFCVWNKDCRCRNCTSMQAAMGNCRRTKYEFIADNVFYVISQPITLATQETVSEVVLEIVSHVSDQLLLEKEDGMSLAERLEAIQEKLYRDDLTQAFNRRYLNEFTFLHRGMERISFRIGLILLDLRQFKAVNDTLGHLAGDQMLEEVAKLLRSHVRAQDSVIRFGGDEFVVILTECDESTVLRKIKELRAAMDQVACADFGYAYTDHFAADQSFLLSMLDQADQRMYAEKRRQAAHDAH
ncbi:GGDEF domain-containing protein [Dysosmobacter sp.]